MHNQFASTYATAVYQMHMHCDFHVSNCLCRLMHIEPKTNRVKDGAVMALNV